MTSKIPWRQFQLFDFTPIRDPNYQSPDPLYSDPSLSAIHATSSYLALATSNCFLKIVNPLQFTLEKQFQAYDADYRISAVSSVPRSNLLVTVAERQGSPTVLKLWDLTKIVHLDAIDPDQEKYKFQTQVLITNGDNSYPISCFQFNDELTCIAIGYTNGKVILVRGDLLRDRGSKQRTIFESLDPVTGVQFNRENDLLYITTTSKILTVLTTGRNNGKPAKYLSNKTGIDLNCSDVIPSTQELVVATQNSIRFYNNLAKVNSFPFEVSKSKLYYIKNSSKNYLLLVSSLEEEISSNNNKKKLVTRILILDLDSRHLSFNLMVPNNVITHVFEQNDNIFLLSNDGILYKLHEKPINQQIEVILQRELFSVAYRLAERNKMSKEVLLRIQKLHGEFLYAKQSFDESIGVFIKCLSLFKSTSKAQNEVESEDDEDLEDFVMNIITKFKDVSNISNLTKFLHKLYSLNIANNDHITLLLCCYCKLKLTDDLDKFIDDLDLENSTDSPFQDLNFQLIINLFQECGYFDQVIKLLYKLNQPNLIVGIQLNHLHQPKQSLHFIKGLPIDDLLLILIDHSKSLLDFLPIETTELLIDVFTGNYKLNKEIRDTFIQDVKVQREEEILHTHEEGDDVSSFPLNSYKAFVTYLSSLKDDDIKSNGSNEQAKIDDESSTQEPTYLPPRPSLIYPSFMNHPNEFVIFLEACIETFDKYQGNINDKKELLMTLLEMYLTIASKLEDGESNEWKDKAKQLVDNNSELLDNSSLLLVSHIYDFKEGEALSKEQSGFEESLFTTYQISEDVEKCFEMVRRYGDQKPELYKLMLKFMIFKQLVFDQVTQQDFRFILNKIEKLKIMNPLEILQILTGGAENEFVTLGLVKDYLIDFIDNQSKEINNNHKLIEYYETESTKTSHKLTELNTKPFVIQNNKCSQCGQKLDYPVIHFRCKHSFHQKCLNNNLIATSVNDDSATEKQCPICINEIDEIKSIRNSQFKSKDTLEVFEGNLHESKDRFKYISEYLGKGVMENESVTLMN
ncbi:vacuolar protein sorting-associated protein 11 [Suhomyces tanzawaensis NRRL Y-17324]|uniref:E3 ubiquitin-protein ligase PEP5 n=1 Tax=Suhomyces tanzawaensis NRRL Y-17324 TaxID=984487 RepID=A0A1E4SCN3_9ASCO|nr:vacuolar protein sorting-associated protein 11 [Suhomyces tanzawaensis NRRL Y-17324]ODV77253.1 vacuolar protein sorting-associated protein 11 [Suhomyces tanzawaensis NRRL Y-17324]